MRVWIVLLLCAMASTAAEAGVCPAHAEFSSVFTAILDQTLDKRVSAIPDPELTFFTRYMQFRDKAIQHVIDDAIRFFSHAAYSGPTFPHSTVPITPLRRCWSSSGGQCSRLQLPLTLAWAVTIHKSQGLTLDKVVIEREFSIGLTFVACSSVRQLQDLLFTPPFPYHRLSSLSNSSRLRERQEEDRRLQSLQPSQPTSSPWTTLGTQPRHSNHHSWTPVAHHCHHLLVDPPPPPPPHTHTHRDCRQQ